MKITYHAAERFIERVLEKKSFTQEELYQAKEYLEALTRDIVISSYSKRFVLPGYFFLLFLLKVTYC